MGKALKIAGRMERGKREGNAWDVLVQSSSPVQRISEDTTMDTPRGRRGLGCKAGGR